MAAIFCPQGEAINTAIGCIPIDSPGSFVGWLLPILLKAMGVIAFFLLVAAGLELITSKGDPQKVKEAQGKITAAVSGLLFTIFSLLILRLVAVEILKIPGIK